jgi:hypothetical protein
LLHGIAASSIPPSRFLTIPVEGLVAMLGILIPLASAFSLAAGLDGPDLVLAGFWPFLHVVSPAF